MENWDLQAVVGGSSNDIDACNSDMENPYFSFEPWSFQQDQEYLMSFPADIFETNPKVLDELQELYYKPFYPELNHFSTQTIITSSLPVPQEMDEPENQKTQQSQSVSDQSVTNKESTPQTPNKPRRSSSRKNQQNRVVQHVTADGLLSDKWAWRKYGQKPIKGSPYPRSYYRCSSSKGCLARKQVERSCSDPRTFIITYTAEHSHGQPTRRNSLAGSTRNKSSSSSRTKTTVANNNNELHEASTESLLSPTTTTIKDEAVQQDYQSIKMEEQMLFEDGELGDKILTPDIMLSGEELVQSLESFEGLFLDQFPDLSYELWSMNHESAS